MNYVKEVLLAKRVSSKSQNNEINCLKIDDKVLVKIYYIEYQRVGVRHNFVMN